MRIVLVPLDERPVNVQIPREVAAIAGVDISVPPSALLPAMREPADLAALHRWLEAEAEHPETTHVVICVDTLVFGGLIPARTTRDTTTEALQRLDILKRIAEKRPELVISAVSLVMRASDSYSAVEEPDYWSEYGRDLHGLGAALHKTLEADAESNDATPPSHESAVPIPIMRDFELRRLRNHMINLACLALHEEQVISTLAVTADDTAPHSAGSAEQLWIRHWNRAMPTGGEVLMYPGADEVGAVLVARALVDSVTDAAAHPRIEVLCAEADGLSRVPNFENAPLQEAIRRQVSAAGGELIRSAENADITIIVHAPDPERRDFFGTVPEGDADIAEATCDLVARAIADGRRVALADVRYSNGADPLLVDRLAERGLLLELASYGGWNTAGNALGSAIAHAIGQWAGARRGTLNDLEARRALLARIVEDRGYQSGIRPALHHTVFRGEIGPVSTAIRDEAIGHISSELGDYLSSITGPRAAWRLLDVHLPWQRSFEIGFSLQEREFV